MACKSVLIGLGLLLAGSTMANDGLPSPAAYCRQQSAAVRALWQHDAFDVPASISLLMQNALDGKLPRVREQLSNMKPADAVRWRQAAMVAAAWATRPTMVDALLDDGAEVNGMGWTPAFKPGFYRQTVADMKSDPRFGGSSAIKGMMAAGVVSNRGQPAGPALLVAAQCGDMATVDVLLRHHADVEARYVGANHQPVGADALVIATVQGEAAIVQRLLDHGADPCSDDRYIESHKPGVSLATIGRDKGFTEALAQRLTCPSMASAH